VERGAKLKSIFCLMDTTHKPLNLAYKHEFWYSKDLGHTYGATIILQTAAANATMIYVMCH
jgi:hypothetical protein